MIYPDLINGVIDNNVSFTLIISAGQSNTLTGSPISASDLQIPNVWQLDRSPNYYCTKGQDPLSHYYGIYNGNIGHDARLGKLIKTNDLAYDEHVLILGQGASGTSFTADQWGVGNFLYTNLKDRLGYVLDRITNIDKIVFSWHQGETDATNAMSEATYKSEFDAQYNDFLIFSIS